jgi:excisionase family DNA binding protein
MVAHETQEPEYCTVAEAAQLLRVSKPTIWRWIEAGRLPAVRFGPRCIRIQRSDLVVLARPVRTRRPMSRAELEQYILPHPSPTMTEEELMADIEAINKRILARRGGKPLESSLPLIHEQRR